nr:cytochrome P450 71A2-like [Tanacetum cinerariifolium]
MIVIRKKKICISKVINSVRRGVKARHTSHLISRHAYSRRLGLFRNVEATPHALATPWHHKGTPFRTLVIAIKGGKRGVERERIRDPTIWEDADEFKPERFLDSNIDYKGLHFELLPFGAGRRGCPGIQFAMSVNKLALASLVYKFDFKLPNGLRLEQLDMADSTESMKGPYNHMLFGIQPYASKMTTRPYGIFIHQYAMGQCVLVIL